jgi:hypothetical protein
MVSKSVFNFDLYRYTVAASRGTSLKNAVTLFTYARVVVAGLYWYKANPVVDPC